MDWEWVVGTSLVVLGLFVTVYWNRRGSKTSSQEKKLTAAKELQAVVTGLESLSKNVNWIMDQLGKDGKIPNSNGMMERINNHIVRQDGHNERQVEHNEKSDAKLEAVTISLAEQKVLLGEHFRYHEGSKDA